MPQAFCSMCCVVSLDSAGVEQALCYRCSVAASRLIGLVTGVALKVLLLPLLKSKCLGAIVVRYR